MWRFLRHIPSISSKPSRISSFCNLWWFQWTGLQFALRIAEVLYLTNQTWNLGVDANRQMDFYFVNSLRLFHTVGGSGNESIKISPTIYDLVNRKLSRTLEIERLFIYTTISKIWHDLQTRLRKRPLVYSSTSAYLCFLWTPTGIFGLPLGFSLCRATSGQRINGVKEKLLLSDQRHVQTSRNGIWQA